MEPAQRARLAARGGSDALRRAARPLPRARGRGRDYTRDNAEAAHGILRADDGRGEKRRRAHNFRAFGGVARRLGRVVLRDDEGARGMGTRFERKLRRPRAGAVRRVYRDGRLWNGRPAPLRARHREVRAHGSEADRRRARRYAARNRNLYRSYRPGRRSAARRRYRRPLLRL